MQTISNKVVLSPRNRLICALQCPELATANHSLHDLANHGYFGKPAIPKLKVTSRSLLPQHIYLIATKHNTAYQIANWRSDNPRSTNLLPQIFGSRTGAGVRLPSHLQALISPLNHESIATIYPNTMGPVDLSPHVPRLSVCACYLDKGWYLNYTDTVPIQRYIYTLDGPN